MIKIIGGYFGGLRAAFIFSKFGQKLIVFPISPKFQTDTLPAIDRPDKSWLDII
jgi:hypothetical protein